MKDRDAAPDVLSDGTVLDDATVARLVADADDAVVTGAASVVFPRRAGRPSLSGAAEHSPKVVFRLTPELRAKAERAAAQRGTTVSALARQALEEFLAS